MNEFGETLKLMVDSFDVCPFDSRIFKPNSFLWFFAVWNDWNFQINDFLSGWMNNVKTNQNSDRIRHTEWKHKHKNTDKIGEKKQQIEKYKIRIKIKTLEAGRLRNDHIFGIAGCIPFSNG